MSQSLSMEVSGDGAVDQAINVLESVDLETGTKKIEITITNISPESDGSNNATSDDSGSKSEEKTRQKGAIRANSAHHYALNALRNLTDGNSKAPAGDIIEAVDEYGPTTVRPSLTALYERMLIEREEVNGANPHYRYWLTNHGEGVLDELGSPK